MRDHLIGMDIGGSHVAGALFDQVGNENSMINKPINSHGSASTIIETISLVINELADKLDGS
jgi:predicted NBD/HSP70 family sugar kinase